MVTVGKFSPSFSFETFQAVCDDLSVVVCSVKYMRGLADFSIAAIFVVLRKFKI